MAFNQELFISKSSSLQEIMQNFDRTHNNTGGWSAGDNDITVDDEKNNIIQQYLQKYFNIIKYGQIALVDTSKRTLEYQEIARQCIITHHYILQN